MSTYWEKKGRYQTDYDLLQKLVPSMGESDIPEIELLRVTSNLYYDCYNNGLCNEHSLFDAVEVFKRYWFELNPLLENSNSIHQFIQLAHDMEAYEEERKNRWWTDEDEEGLDRWEDDFSFDVRALFAPLEDVTNAVIQYVKEMADV